MEAIQLEIVCINANVDYDTLINCVQNYWLSLWQNTAPLQFELEVKQVTGNCRKATLRVEKMQKQYQKITSEGVL